MKPTKKTSTTEAKIQANWRLRFFCSAVIVIA
jgi:hypothetical protein